MKTKQKSKKMLAILLLLLGLVGRATAGWVTSGDNMYADVPGNVGIGTTNPDAKLTVEGPIGANITFIETPGMHVITLPGRGGTIYGHYMKGKWTVPPIIAGSVEPTTDGETYDFIFTGNETYGFLGGSLTLGGPLPFTYSTYGIGVYGEVTTGTGMGVYGVCTVEGDIKNYGGYFKAAGGRGCGVYGEASNSGNYENYGGYFKAAGIRGRGVYGVATYTTPPAPIMDVVSFNDVDLTSATPSYTPCGGYFEADDGIGVYGKGSGYGVYGHTNSPSGKAVYGEASNSEDTYNFGGYFLAAGAKGRGVFGRGSGTGNVRNFGGWFEAEGNDGVGVYGTAWTGTGGHFAAPEGYGVIAEGDTGVKAYGRNFDFFAAGPGTSYGSSSSIRWKTNIQLIDGPLRKVLNMRGVYFDWDKDHGGHHDVGMIAEEVGEVMPELVQYEEDGVYTIGMDYSKLTPLLVEAIKELKEQIDEQQKQLVEKDTKIAELEQMNKGIQARLAAIEAAVAKHTVWQDGTAQRGLE